MNDKDFAHIIVSHLDEGADRLEPRISKRLHAARQAALAHHAPYPSLNLVNVSNAGGLLLGEMKSFSRSWLGLGSLVACVALTQYWAQEQRTAELEEVDSALLSDDLPIAAYLDHDFSKWLKN